MSLLLLGNCKLNFDIANIFSYFFYSSSIGTTEDELKVHFKEKHKINTVKPFLIKRICRICDHDKSTSNAELIKHIETEHPRSNFGDDEDDEEEENGMEYF